MEFIKLSYCYLIPWYHRSIFSKRCCLSLWPSGSGPRLRCLLMFRSADEWSHLLSGNPRAPVRCPLDSHARLSVTSLCNTPQKNRERTEDFNHLLSSYCSLTAFLPCLGFPRPGVSSWCFNNVARLFIVLLASKFIHRKQSQFPRHKLGILLSKKRHLGCFHN